MRRSLPLVADGPAGRLGGTLHLPGSSPSAVVLMVPGSGPSDRDNDEYFPPIRAGLLERELAAASFDKRGVGESDGDWHATGPGEQADDVAAQLAALRAEPALASIPIGLFGHSQGGWVVLEAGAADAGVAFVITSSGPGVSPAAQERYAVGAKLAAERADDEGIALMLRRFDAMVAVVRGGGTLDELRRVAGGFDDPELARLTLVPADDEELRLVRRWLDHDPRPAIGRLRCPLLALFGGADRVVPVQASVDAFVAASPAAPGAVRIEVLAGADHRMRVGDPPALHPAYAATLGDWIGSVVATRR